METIKKRKLFFDPAKELAFLNKMNDDGWKLTGVRFGYKYTFEKCEEGAYFTLLFADRKDNVLGAQAKAAGAGFESVPHSGDGMGGLLYLTGKKGEADASYADDKRAQARAFAVLRKRFSPILILTVILDALILIEAVAFTMVFAGYLPAMSVFLWLLFIAAGICSAAVFAIAARLGKSAKKRL